VGILSLLGPSIHSLPNKELSKLKSIKRLAEKKADPIWAATIFFVLNLKGESK